MNKSGRRIRLGWNEAETKLEVEKRNGHRNWHWSEGMLKEIEKLFQPCKYTLRLYFLFRFFSIVIIFYLNFDNNTVLSQNDTHLETFQRIINKANKWSTPVTLSFYFSNSVSDFAILKSQLRTKIKRGILKPRPLTAILPSFISISISIGAI